MRTESKATANAVSVHHQFVARDSQKPDNRFWSFIELYDSMQLQLSAWRNARFAVIGNKVTSTLAEMYTSKFDISQAELRNLCAVAVAELCLVHRPRQRPPRSSLPTHLPRSKMRKGTLLFIFLVLVFQLM